MSTIQVSVAYVSGDLGKIAGDTIFVKLPTLAQLRENPYLAEIYALRILGVWKDDRGYTCELLRPLETYEVDSKPDPVDSASLESQLAQVYTGKYGAKFGFDSEGAWHAVGAYKLKALKWEQVCEELGLLGADAIDDIVDTYLAAHPLPVEIGSGDDIHAVFTTRRKGSCMGYKNSACHTMREFYAVNSDRVAVASWEVGSHPMLSESGSCLIWRGSDCSYVDRVYGGFAQFAKPRILERISELLARPAKVIHSSWRDCGLEYVTGKIKFHGLNLTREGILPYIDTLSNVRYNPDDDTVDLSNCGLEFEAQCTDGTDAREGGDRVDFHCCNCGEGMRYDDDNHRVTDSGDVYCDSCFDELFSYCEYYEVEVPSDSISYQHIVDQCGRELAITICDDAISSEFYLYEGHNSDYRDFYIHRDVSIETACGKRVLSHEVADCDETDLDGFDWVLPKFEADAVETDAVAWSETFDAWVLAEDLADYEELSRYFSYHTDGTLRRSLGDSFHLELLENSGCIRLMHSNGGGWLGISGYNYWQQLRRAGYALSRISCEVPYLFAPDFELSQWRKIGACSVLREIVNSANGLQ